MRLLLKENWSDTPAAQPQIEEVPAAEETPTEGE